MEVQTAVIVLVSGADEPAGLHVRERLPCSTHVTRHHLPPITDVSHQVLELPGVHSPTPVLVEGPEGELHHLLVLVASMISR